MGGWYLYELYCNIEEVKKLLRGALSKEINEELVSLVLYGVITYFALTSLKWANIIGLDFNLVFPSIIIDYAVTALVVFVAVVSVEYIENQFALDLDKFDKTEQITGIILATVFYPILWMFGNWGALVPITFTFAKIETILVGLAITTGLFTMAGILAIYLALKMS